MSRERSLNLTGNMDTVSKLTISWYLQNKHAEAITGLMPMTFYRFVEGAPFRSAPVKGAFAAK